MSKSCERIQCNMLGIGGVKILFDHGAFFCHSGRVDRDRYEPLGSDEQDDEDFQQILADYVRAVNFIFYFPVDLPDQVSYRRLVFSIGEYLY